MYLSLFRCTVGMFAWCNIKIEVWWRNWLHLYVSASTLLVTLRFLVGDVFPLFAYSHIHILTYLPTYLLTYLRIYVFTYLSSFIDNTTNFNYQSNCASIVHSLYYLQCSKHKHTHKAQVTKTLDVLLYCTATYGETKIYSTSF